MIQEPRIPIDDLIAEAIEHFGVGKKVKVVDNRTEGAFCDKEVVFKRRGLDTSAPLLIDNTIILQNNRPNALRRLIRERFGKALHHLIAHGAEFK